MRVRAPQAPARRESHRAVRAAAESERSGELRRAGAQRQEPPGERRAGARVFVLEEDIGVVPAGADRVDRLDPAPQRVVRVLDGAEPEVAEVRGGDRRRRALLGVGDTQRDVARAEQRVDLVVEPALVTDSKAARNPSGRLASVSARRSGAFLKFGGSWKSSGPSLSPSARAASQKYESGSATPRSRRKCVMRCGALRT